MKQMIQKDSRIRIINEVFNGIKVCKYFHINYLLNLFSPLDYQALCLGDSIPAAHFWYPSTGGT